MLFSEPKIPQLYVTVFVSIAIIWFQCSSASRKFLNSEAVALIARWQQQFQCSSASRKFLNDLLKRAFRAAILFQCSSASRKFLNVACLSVPSLQQEFQCSSASRKFLNEEVKRAYLDLGYSFSALQRAENSSIVVWRRLERPVGRFSALQRAENSSIDDEAVERARSGEFQCSSASRKFLNACGAGDGIGACRFQCSSASRKFLNPDPRTCVHPYFRPR